MHILVESIGVHRRRIKSTRVTGGLEANSGIFLETRGRLYTGIGTRSLRNKHATCEYALFFKQ